jgi:hypothetical protein
MQTLLDTLAGLANDGKWYSRTALGAKLNGKRSVLAAISRLRRVPGYRVEKRRVTEHATSGSTASPPGLPSPLLDGLFLPRLPTTIPAIPRQVATMTGLGQPAGAPPGGFKPSAPWRTAASPRQRRRTRCGRGAAPSRALRMVSQAPYGRVRRIRVPCGDLSPPA